MPKDVPKAGDDVKLGLNRVKLFGPHGPDCGVPGEVALHSPAWLEQHKSLNTSRLCDAVGASAIATPDVEHGNGTRRDRGKNQLIDAIQIRLSLFRQTRKDRCDPIVGGHGIDTSVCLDLPRSIVVGLTHSLLSMEPRVSMEPTFLPGVENHPQPSPYADLIRSMQAAGSEYMQIWHLFAFKPEMTAHLARFSQAVLREPAPISPGIRELIAAYTSSLNRCAFCTKAHIGFAAALLEKERNIGGEEFAEAVVRDMEKSALDENEKTLFRLAEKVNHGAQQIKSEDMMPMYAAGWDDEAIYYVITICAFFNFYNRWVGASGVHVLSDEAHRLAGKRSAETGYVRK
jgi:uncharacterized peroxidase-related enzyme